MEIKKISYYDALGLLHDSIFLSLLFLVPSYILLKIKDAKFRDKLKRSINPRFNDKGIPLSTDIIIHSSSIGETKNAILFSEILHQKINEKTGKEIKIAHTVFTSIAAQTFQNTIPIPIPFYLNLTKFIPDRVKLLLFFESDFWPAYIIASKKHGAKVGVISGKMSEKSMLLHRTLTSSFIKELDFAFAISDKHAEMFRKLGIQKIFTSINMKKLIFIRQEPAKSEKKNKNKCVIGISTRGIKEVDFLLHTYNGYKKLCGNNITLFIAPRHNFEETKKLLSQRVKFTSISDIKGKIIQEGVILIDRYGYIDNILKICDLAFVGGSIEKIGGHNILEPISAGVPVVTGPNIWNIEEKDEMIKKGCLKIVSSPYEMVKLIITNNENMKKNAVKFREEQKKIVEKEIDKISDFITEVLQLSQNNNVRF